MAAYSRVETAGRAGVDTAYVERLVDLGILAPSGEDQFSAGDVRRVVMVQALEGAGIPLDGLAAALRSGALSLAFMDAASYERFAALAGETFQQVSDRTGIPLHLLLLVREAIGSAQPSPGDRMREDEMAIVPFLEIQIAHGFRPIAIERLMRVQGDSLRRMAETEAAWWNSEVVMPALAAGKGPEEIANVDFSDELNTLAELAGTLARLVQRSSLPYGGKPIKWLGDGVMFHFRDPGPGVQAALEMRDGVASAGLPPAHVGLHTGPVLFQEGDYYGQTVNVAARIADVARPGEVLVSEAVADASQGIGLVFQDIGPVELKGVSGAMHLLSARQA